MFFKNSQNTKGAYTWKNAHRRKFHTWMTSWFCITFTWWLGHFIPCLHENWIKIANMASIVSDMFSATAAVAVVSAINLSNSFTNLMLSKLISRRNNLARLSVLENSAITRCRHKLFKKRPQKKKRFWIKPGQTDLWWRNMKEDRCLEEEFYNEQSRISEACWRTPTLYFTQPQIPILDWQKLRMRYPFQSTCKPISPRKECSFCVYMIPLWNLVPEGNSRPSGRTGVNSRWGDSYRHDILWWYHVNKCRAMRGNQSDLAPGRKLPRCHVNTPLFSVRPIPCMVDIKWWFEYCKN